MFLCPMKLLKLLFGWHGCYFKTSLKFMFLMLSYLFLPIFINIGLSRLKWQSSLILIWRVVLYTGYVSKLCIFFIYWTKNVIQDLVSTVLITILPSYTSSMCMPNFVQIQLSKIVDRAKIHFLGKILLKFELWPHGSHLESIQN